LLDQHVRSVPIVDDTGELTGIVSRHEILRTLVRADDLTQPDVQQRLDDHSGDWRRWTATISPWLSHTVPCVSHGRSP
jgi:hypothetical protein